MRLVIFASGSTGNCALVRGGGRSVLLDAGISAKRICESLAAEEMVPEDLDGVFITHEHADHVSGLAVLLKRHSLPIFAPGGAADALRRSLPEHAALIRTLVPERPVSLGCMTVTAFSTPHDAAASVGYRFEADGAVLATATDTGCVTDGMLRLFAGADAALIEAILSDQGHLSNAECTWLAAVLARQGTGKIVLGHISKNNNLPGLARRTVCRALEGTGAELYVAPESGHLALEVSPCCV